MTSVSGTQKFLSKRKGQKGQMAIFIALIFQVLFVFFAMAINIGLVVHDKINLQNAVDLAAYYAAQRQAEWLNVIGHQNYQIRQSYKLMTWRYRVLGTMGVDQPPNEHPQRKQGTPPDALDPAVEIPVACIAYRPAWMDVVGDESVCRRPYTPGEVVQIISEIAVADVVNIFGPWNFSLRRFAQAANRQIGQRCQTYGGFNYLYANLVKFAFRNDQYRIKQSIRALAQNLARPATEMIDLNGDPVFVGVQKTFLKNLTLANTAVDELKVFNSIEGLPPDRWLNEVRVNLNLLYADIQSGGGCNAVVKGAGDLPQRPDGIQALEDAMGMSAEELQAQFQDPPPTDPRRMSLGFEKNPWVKLFMGVRAKTRPRQLFFPFGEPVQFEAVAYATPFGGRIGPWYGSSWPQGSPTSTGAPLDALLPPLFGTESAGASPTEQLKILPNYSRYPGDPLGLNSSLAQAAVPSLLSQFQSQIGDLNQVFLENAEEVPDFLSWNGDLNNPARKFEVAAVVPDLFDITYYNIEPNFARTYLPKLRSLANALGIPQDALPRGDLGHRDRPQELSEFSVQDQMAITGSQSLELDTTGDFFGSGQSLYRPEAYFVVRNRAHLLTSWVHNDIVANYLDFPDARFGNCTYWDDDLKYKMPGSCVSEGGRVGYSVKIIHGNHLRSSALQYGGPNQVGAILNPPPESW